MKSLDWLFLLGILGLAILNVINSWSAATVYIPKIFAAVMIPIVGLPMAVGCSADQRTRTLGWMLVAESMLTV